MRTVFKAADTSRLGITAATADPELQFGLEVNSTYLIRGQVYFRGSTAGDVKHGFFAGGATLTYAGGASFTSHEMAADSAISERTGGAWTAAMIAAGSTRPIAGATGAFWVPVKFALMLKIGGTGGTFSIVWAQNTADALSPAKCLAGSLITYEKLP